MIAALVVVGYLLVGVISAAGTTKFETKDADPALIAFVALFWPALALFAVIYGMTLGLSWLISRARA
jgi:hypothetical protein